MSFVCFLALGERQECVKNESCDIFGRHDWLLGSEDTYIFTVSLFFQREEVKFLICTDVAARGIDIRGLPFGEKIDSY